MYVRSCMYARVCMLVYVRSCMYFMRTSECSCEQIGARVDTRSQIHKVVTQLDIHEKIVSS